MKSEPRKINGMLRTIIKAISHYEKTGKHKQVIFKYKAENRTAFDFSTWKHESQEDSPRMILPEELYVSGAGEILVRGVENRYNLKQYQSQYKNDHPRSYRIDRMIL